MAHEFGHAVGLNHIFEYRRLMMGAAAENTFVSASECSAMRTSSLDPNGPNNLTAFDSDLPAFGITPDLDAIASIPVEEAARAPIIDQVPMYLADMYGQDDVAVLRGLLGTEREPAHRGTITSLIAIISDGSDIDAETLIALARAGSESVVVTAASYLGLGYIREPRQ